MTNPDKRFSAPRGLPLTTKDLHIHLAPSIYIKPGNIHLLASPADFKELQEFFSTHFNTISPIYDEMGFPEQWFKCPKGTMFMRNEKGELVRMPKTPTLKDLHEIARRFAGDEEGE